MDIGTLLFYGLVALWSAIVAYGVLGQFPSSKAHTAPASHAQAHPAVSTHHASEPHRQVPAIYGNMSGPQTPAVLSSGFNPKEGFKSFQRGGELTVDDIVTGLSRQ